MPLRPACGPGAASQGFQSMGRSVQSTAVCDDIAEAYRTCRSGLVNIGVFSCCINLLMFTGPLFMLQVYDRVLTSRSMPTLLALTLLVAFLFAMMGLLEFVRARLMARIGRRVDEQLAGTIFDRTVSLGLGPSAAGPAQPLRDLDTLRQFLSGPAPLALFEMPWAPVFLAVIFLLHVWLGVFATLGALALFGLALANELRTRDRSKEAAQANMDAHAFAEESRRNAEAAWAMGMGPFLRARWLQLHRKALSTQDLANDRSGTISASSKVMRLFLQSAMLAVGAWLAVRQEITPGTMIAASIIMSRALAPVEQSIGQWRSFQSFRRANERLKEVVGEASSGDAEMAFPRPRGFIHAENLLVLDRQSGRPILQGVNFKLEPGRALGVIGPSGAGKSTLARTLVGTWQTSAGAVRVDGAPIAQWGMAQLGPAIGYLPQNVELFAGTIAENIARFDPNASPESVLRAASHANAHDLILKLPHGYKTSIGNGGATLSAGQRQRIGLARALYGDPVFVVLDEPNSNLDAVGETALEGALRALKSRGASLVVITHRPSAIQVVDLLLVLKNGRQVALGPRNQVLGETTTALPRAAGKTALQDPSRRAAHIRPTEQPA